MAAWPAGLPVSRPSCGFGIALLSTTCPWRQCGLCWCRARSGVASPIVIHAERASPSSEGRVTNTVIYVPIRRDALPGLTRKAPLGAGILGRLALGKDRTSSWRPSHAPSRTMTAGPGSSVRPCSARMATPTPSMPRLGSLVSAAAWSSAASVRTSGSSFSHVHLHAHCSLTPEPFGQVVVEDMVAGVPVTVADAGGPAEIITHMVNGMLTALGDLAALAAAMRRIRDGARARRSCRGLRRRNTTRRRTPRAFCSP